MKADNLDIGK